MSHHEPSASLQLLALAGSLRRNSWNRLLLRAAAGCAPPGVAVTVYEGLASIPPFNEDTEGEGADGAPAPVLELRRAVATADGLLISTPEYNQSIPGVLKNAVDWLSRPHGASCLPGKPAAVVGATTGPWGTRLAQRELRHVLWATDARVLPGPPLYLRHAAQAFDGEGHLTDERTRGTLERLLAAFAEWIRTSRG